MASRINNINVKGGYWLAQQANILPPEDIPIAHFTHLFYGFAAIHPETFSLHIAQDQLIQRFMQKIRTGSPQPKASLSIGGPKTSEGNDPSTVIADMARKLEARTHFIDSAIKVALRYGFDGLDLAWEFPKTSQDMKNMVFLFQEWHQQIQNREVKLFLTATVYFSPNIQRGDNNIKYPAVALNDCLEFLNVIAYNYSPSTCARSQISFNPEIKCTSLGINLWLGTDAVSANKLVLGIPLYGHKLRLADQDDDGPDAPVESYDGVVAYRDIPGGKHGNYDAATVTQYLSHRNTWYGYDGPVSIKAKVKYAKTLQPNSLGGYFLYPLGDDDDQHTLSNAASMA